MIIRCLRVKRLLLLLVLLLALVSVVMQSKPFLRLFYPVPYQDEVTRYSRQFELDPLLVMAVMRAESKFNPYAESGEGAAGLMQLMPDTAKWAASRMNLDYSSEKLFEPEFNIAVGCWYFSSLISQYGGMDHLAVALAAYNGGRTNVNKWLQEKTWDGSVSDLESIPFSETKEYVRVVLKNYEIYKKVYDS